MSLEKYKTASITPSRILKLFYIIGELRGADHPTLTSVKNSPYQHLHSVKHFKEFLTDNYLTLTENGIYELSGKGSKELDNSTKYKKVTKQYWTRHLKKSHRLSWGEHRQLLCRTLLPIMFSANYYLTFYPSLSYHGLQPDACIVFKYPRGYQLKFLEVETEDHGEKYLFKKRDGYISAAQDLKTWSSWWKRHHADLGLPYCSQEQFCFSVLCKGTNVFEQNGWEWI